MKLPTTTELIAYSQSSEIEEIISINSEIDALRPLSRDKEEQIMQKLRLDWNYNSNAIEGNSLDYGETVAFLMHGVTSKGKPLKDFLDIRGHNNAINYILDLIKDDIDITEKDIRSLHEIILVEPYKAPAQTLSGQNVQKTIELGKYKSLPNHVKTATGEIHYYASPEETPILMGQLMDWYRSIDDNVHPVVVAALFHYYFVSIHPFDDGNGRMARLLMNMIFMRHHYPPVVIKKDNKDQYYYALSQADSGNIESFILYIAENLLNTLNLYLKGAKGESIEEISDLDKKLALFKKELESRQDKVEIKRTPEVKQDIVEHSIQHLISSTTLTVSKFRDMFLGYEELTMDIVGGQISEREWRYSEFSFSSIDTILDRVYSDDVLSLCVRLNDFKLESNPFSVEVKIIIVFHDLNYKVFYSISRGRELEGLKLVAYSQWLKNSGPSKYYHQQLSTKEIEKVTNDIGNILLGYIENAYNDPKSETISLKTNDVYDCWDDFLNENYSNDISISLNFRQVLSVNIKNTMISLVINPEEDDLTLFLNEREKLATKFQGYLVSKGLVKKSVIINIY